MRHVIQGQLLFSGMSFFSTSSSSLIICCESDPNLSPSSWLLIYLTHTTGAATKSYQHHYYTPHTISFDTIHYTTIANSYYSDTHTTLYTLKWRISTHRKYKKCSYYQKDYTTCLYKEKSKNKFHILVIIVSVTNTLHWFCR